MDRRARKARDDQDGVRVFEIRDGRRPRLAALAAATIAAVAGLYLFFGRGKQAVLDVPMSPVVESGARQPNAPAPARPLRRPPAAHVAEVAEADRRAANLDRHDAEGEQNPALEVEVPADDPSQLEGLARALIEKLAATGQGGGLAAFPPPGTNPVKTGIVVPETYELPEGYVRYYQVTDDGRRLEPILMYSPDYEILGSDGEPIEVPEDGIVPPDMAPPGLPVRMLEIPSGEPGSR